jgi:hypothetical protein
MPYILFVAAALLYFLIGCRLWWRQRPAGGFSDESPVTDGYYF